MSSASTPSPAIIAALPREVSALVRGHPPDAAGKSRGVYLHRLPQTIVVAAGMGSERATMAVEAASAEAPISLLVSVGLAGSCSASLRAGDVVEAGVVIDARTGERWATQASGGVVLVSGSSIADVREKKRLHESYGAAMVDMEAATVARLAVMRGIPFRAIKGISDAHDFELASLAAFSGSRGEFRTLAFALHTAVRPHAWKKTSMLGRDSARALEGLTEALRRLIGA